MKDLQLSLTRIATMWARSIKFLIKEMVSGFVNMQIRDTMKVHGQMISAKAKDVKDLVMVIYIQETT